MTKLFTAAVALASFYAPWAHGSEDLGNLPGSKSALPEVCDPARSGEPNTRFNPVLFSRPQSRLAWIPNSYATDPRRHDPRAFTYLVHMIDMMASSFSPRSSFDFLSKKVATNQCSAFSTSLINQDHVHTFGGVGFILEVPAENILLTSACDIGSQALKNNHDGIEFNKTLNAYAPKLGFLKTPDELMRLAKAPASEWCSPDIWYNEVLVQGKAVDGVKIVGIIINMASKTRKPSDPMLSEIKAVAKQENLPIVTINQAD